jgi:TadE-like protein
MLICSRRTRWRWLLMAAALRRGRRVGQAMVELTLVIGLFMLLILGLVSVGQVLLANYTVSQAARAAAHQAAIAGGAPEAAEAAAAQVLDAGVGTRARSLPSLRPCDCHGGLPGRILGAPAAPLHRVRRARRRDSRGRARPAVRDEG